MTWYEAIDYCKAMDAYLAEVLNDKTQNLLAAQALLEKNQCGGLGHLMKKM